MMNVIEDILPDHFESLYEADILHFSNVCMRKRQMLIFEAEIGNSLRVMKIIEFSFIRNFTSV